ncbi:MAG TPA: hypothetical protein PKX15_01925 [Bacteroidales bacterium]|nr:hypothetical protein [Bacteroidales bacterium]
MPKNIFHIRLLVLLPLLLLLSNKCLLHAQSLSNRINKTIVFESDTLQLDSLSLVPGSLKISAMDTGDYELDQINALLILKNKSFIGKPLNIEYRRFPYRINKAFSHKDTNVIEKNLYEPVNPLMINDAEPNDFLNLSDASLQSSGSLSRGISIGSNQDMSVQSNLNLQLSGKLSDDVDIIANITDQNIPFQPEGNTRQIQEFDKIYIQLNYKDRVSLLAGDIEDKSSDTYFMQFTKKGQGLMGDVLLLSETKKKDTTAYHIKVSGAVAKGNFRRQSIVAIEGNQGPYQLSGENQENFIIILSGSERIYIDGKLLTRGQDADYVINYNSGELTFTAKQPITKDKRIVAEFEYSDQNYVRTLAHIGTEIKQKKWNFSFHFYNEQDMKNQSNQLELNDQNIAFLRQIGNNVNQAYYPYIDSVGFQENEVMYKKIDTLVNGITYDSVFVYSTHADSAYYRLKFTLVDQGKGNYVLTQSSANGRVFAWVAPINGIPQGNYEPIILLITPKRIQMYHLNVSYELPKNTFVHFETALSNNDVNTFSTIGNSQNVGMALRFMLKNTARLPSKKTLSAEKRWKMHTALHYETKNKWFDYIENYRDVEFVRNYNLADSLTQATEHFTGLNLSFDQADKGHIGWSSNVFLIPAYAWHAIQNQFITDLKLRAYTLQINASLLNSQSQKDKTLFLKHDELFSRSFRYFEIGLHEQMEYNQFKQNDSLTPLSRAFNEIAVFLKQNDSIARDYNYILQYSNRIDQAVTGNHFSTSAIAHNLKAGFDMLKFANHPLRFTLSYRNLRYKDSLAATQAPENTLLASIDYQGQICKGAIQWGLFYELGSGMEQKNAYTYIKVANNQGTYQWIDYNGNGIEELDEFEVAIYKDQANYIRLWLVSNEYIKTFNNKLTQSLGLRPAAVWYNKKGIKKFIARFANQTTYQTQLKQTAADFISTINLFYSNLTDTALVSTAMHFRNAFSFNQNSLIWGLDAIYSHSKNKLLTVNGFESSNLNDWQFSGRCRIFKDFILKLNYYHKLNTKNSEYFKLKNYRILTNSMEPILTYQFDNQLTASILYAYIQKINTTGEERSYTHKLTSEINYRMPKRGSLLTQISYYHIQFKGKTSAPCAYEMLEALQPGHNGVVTIAYQTTILKNLQMNLMYEGRISTGVAMIHTGSVEIRAYF